MRVKKVFLKMTLYNQKKQPYPKEEDEICLKDFLKFQIKKQQRNSNTRIFF